MDKSAIEAIQNSAAQAAQAVQPVLPEHLAAVPNAVSLTNLEPFLQGRTRFRGRLTTDSIPDFIGYTKDRAGGAGFIDTDKLGATVFFNLGDKDSPGHADHTARLDLKATPAFAAMISADGVAHSQREVIDFIEDWSHVFAAQKEVEPGVFEKVPLAKALAAIRRVKIEAKSATETTEGNFRQAQSRLDSVEASSDEGLPDTLTFTTEPYFGLQTRTFAMRLSVMTGGREPALRFRVVGLDQAKEDIAQEFKALLLREVGDAATMTIGTFKP